MTLSRSPSPVPGGGWSSPGLTLNSGRSSPANVSAGPVMWESAKMKHYNPSTYPSFSTQNKGFFSRHIRRLSSTLPRFNSRQYADKEKLGRGRRWIQRVPLVGRIRSIFGRMGRKLKMCLLFILVLILCYTIFYTTRKLRLVTELRKMRLLTCAQPSFTTGEDHQSAVAAINSLSSWAQTLEAASWSGRVLENGPLNETACGTSENT